MPRESAQDPCSLNKSGSAMRTYVDFHLFLIINE